MSARIPAPDTHREDLQELGIVLLVNAAFLALVALLLWPLDRPLVSLHLAKGYAVLWLLLIASMVLLICIEKLFRLNRDTHYDLYVTGNLVVSSGLIAGWSAFAALAMRQAAVGASDVATGFLYAVGFLACYGAFVVTTSFYKGSIYKLITLPLVSFGFIVFALWPALARNLFGWFFALFGMAGF